MDFLKQIIDQILSIWRKLEINQKITLAVMTSVFLVSLLLLINWTRRTDYLLLYSNLTVEDAAVVVDKLKEKNIPYRLKGGGTTILIPESQIHEIRLQLAMEGIPRGGQVGFEIFDNTNLIGMTRFMEKINYQRALQGELARSIQSLSEITQARVHLAIPESSPFMGEEKVPTASVVLRLRPGAKLLRNQTSGIAYLVASAVEDLNPQNIAIIDEAGNMLYGAQEEGPLYLAANQLELRKSIEQYLTSKVNSILVSVLGPNRAVVRVDAKISFDQIRKTMEYYDPKGRVVQSETRSEEIKKGGITSPQGTPGVETNLGEGEVLTQSSPSEERKEESTTQYVVNKTMEEIIKGGGNVEKLSIAVAIDGTYKNIPGQGKEYVPRSEEEMNKLTSIVKEATGYSESREDTLVVSNVPFDTSYQEVEEKAWEKLARQDFLKYLIRYALVGLGLLIPFLLLRNLLKGLVLPKKRPAPFKLEKVGEVEPALAPQQKELVQQHVFNLVQNKPEQVTQIIRDWITNHGKVKNGAR